MNMCVYIGMKQTELTKNTKMLETRDLHNCIFIKCDILIKIRQILSAVLTYFNNLQMPIYGSKSIFIQVSGD